MLDSDLARQIELERRDAERSLAERVIAILKTDSVNITYRQAYKRIIKKVAGLVNINDL